MKDDHESSTMSEGEVDDGEFEEEPLTDELGGSQGATPIEPKWQL